MLSWEEGIEKETEIWMGWKKQNFSWPLHQTFTPIVLQKCFYRILEETLYCLRDTLAGCNWAIWGVWEEIKAHIKFINLTNN